MKHLFILNPTAGHTCNVEETTEMIRAAMAGRRETYEIRKTFGPRHAMVMTMEASMTGEEVRVYACGGDGTLNEVVCGAAGCPQVSVTHIPSGIGNDFIKMFGADSARFEDVGELLNGETAPFDLIECGDRYAINICSVGLDARIAKEVHRYSKLPFIHGKGTYNLSALVNFIKGIHMPFEVETDGVRRDGRYTMLIACNGRYYGGGYCPVPEAEPDDGLLDFLLCGPVSRLTIAKRIVSFSEGRWKEHPEIYTHLRGKELKVRADKPCPVNLDGEILDMQEVGFRLSEHKVNFIFPRGASWRKSKITADCTG